MREVCFENYDPNFREIVKDGDILVSGLYAFSESIFSCSEPTVEIWDMPGGLALSRYVQRSFLLFILARLTGKSQFSNFGCGSSREQAATAILAKKIPLVIAGTSFRPFFLFPFIFFSIFNGIAVIYWTAFWKCLTMHQTLERRILTWQRQFWKYV